MSPLSGTLLHEEVPVACEPDNDKGLTLSPDTLLYS